MPQHFSATATPAELLKEVLHGFEAANQPKTASSNDLIPTTLRLMHKVLGQNVVIVNAAGCMTLLATYPFTPLRSSWLYTTMASASAGAQGIRDALDVLIAKGRIPQSEGTDFQFPVGLRVDVYLGSAR